MKEVVIKNTATVAEAQEVFNKSGITIHDDDFLMYVQIPEEDDKPDQLIGMEEEKDGLEQFEDLFFSVVAAGPNVRKVKVGGKAQLYPKYTQIGNSVVNRVVIGGLMFLHAPENPSVMFTK